MAEERREQAGGERQGRQRQMAEQVDEGGEEAELAGVERPHAAEREEPAAAGEGEQDEEQQSSSGKSEQERAREGQSAVGQSPRPHRRGRAPDQREQPGQQGRAAGEQERRAEARAQQRSDRRLVGKRVAQLARGHRAQPGKVAGAEADRPGGSAPAAPRGSPAKAAGRAAFPPHNRPEPARPTRRWRTKARPAKAGCGAAKAGTMA